MNKLEMAHDFAMKLIAVGATNKTEDIIRLGWEYADAMQAEWDSRINKDRPTVLQEEFQPTGYETPTDEWQPDWSQAPEWAVAWVMTTTREYWWASDVFDHNNDGGLKVVGHGMKLDKAPSFNYQGNWQDSLRKRP